MHHLDRHIKGFRDESAEVRVRLAYMVWTAGEKHRRHAIHDDAISFAWQELEALFGRGRFFEINGRLKMFETSDNWWSESGATRAFWLSDRLQAARAKYLNARAVKAVRLLLPSGKAMRSIPPAIGSRDSRGSNAKAKMRPDGLPLVRVDMEMLARLKVWLRGLADDWRNGRAPTDDLFAKIPALEVLDRYAESCSQIMRLANVDVGGKTGFGQIPHHYIEARSGRLYAKGISLQTAPLIVKQAALVGQWEYDFSNCHYSIIDQMAARFGYECQAIRHYLATKSQTRADIAAAAGITIEQAKMALLAVMYGARTSTSPLTAIPQEIGVEAAGRLYVVPQFMGIAEDVSKAREAILSGWPRTRNGSLTNDYGKAIKAKGEDGKTTPTAELLAHLVQGVEVTALTTAMQMFPDQIVLLQHDGWVSNQKLDHQAIEQAVLQATGYRLLLEWEQIQVDPTAPFARARAQATRADPRHQNATCKKPVSPMKKPSF